jgi:hypothetical protein
MMFTLLGIATVLSVTASALAQQPPRDRPREPRAGTAAISGLVLSDEAQPKPLRRARVTISGAEFTVSATLITNDDGTFLFDRLPAGRYTIAAAKDAYVTTAYGASRPDRPGSPIVVRGDERRQVTLRLPRGAVITGTVMGSDGQLLPGVIVAASVRRFLPIAAERILQPVGSRGVTDDRGVYRIFGLAPGDYLVSASVRLSPGVPSEELRLLSDGEIRRALAEVRDTAARSQPGASATPRPSTAPPGSEAGRTVTYAPLFYPGTPVTAQATTITLTKGEERNGVDISLQYVATARIEGSVFSSRPGQQQISVMLTPNQMGADFGLRQSRTASPDGRFTFSGVPPGTYTIIARSAIRPPAPGGPAVMLSATADVNVDGENIGNVMLTLEPGLTIAGRLVFEGAQPPAVDFTKLRVNFPLALTGFSAAPFPPLQLDAGGRFTAEGVPAGVFRISNTIQGLRDPIGRWWLKSIAIDGRELLDRPFEFRQSTDNTIVTFSDRASTVAGVARDARGLPADGIAVVAFGVDESSWFTNSRRVAGVNAKADGTYSIRNLPAGDYFVVASYDVMQGEWFDPALLQRLKASSMRISLGENEAKTQDVVLK